MSNTQTSQLNAQVIFRVNQEINNLIEEYKIEINKAFIKNTFELNLSLKVNIKSDDSIIKITPSLSFYPEPKLVSEKYTVKIDPQQIQFDVLAKAKENLIDEPTEDKLRELNGGGDTYNGSN